MHPKVMETKKVLSCQEPSATSSLIPIKETGINKNKRFQKK